MSPKGVEHKEDEREPLRKLSEPINVAERR